MQRRVQIVCVWAITLTLSFPSVGFAQGAPACPQALMAMQEAEEHLAEWKKNLAIMDEYHEGKNASIAQAVSELRNISFQDAVQDMATDVAFEASMDTIQTFGKRCVKVAGKLIAKANAVVTVINNALSLSRIAPGVIDALGLNSAARQAYEEAQSKAIFRAGAMQRATKRYQEELEKCKCKKPVPKPPEPLTPGAQPGPGNGVIIEGGPGKSSGGSKYPPHTPVTIIDLQTRAEIRTTVGNIPQSDLNGYLANPSKYRVVFGS